MGRRGKRLKHLQDKLEEMSGYRNSKEEALYSTTQDYIALHSIT
jgi:hypothetical protein